MGRRRRADTVSAPFLAPSLVDARRARQPRLGARAIVRPRFAAIASSARLLTAPTWRSGRGCLKSTDSFALIWAPAPTLKMPRTSEDTEFGRRLMAAGERLRYEPSAIVYHPVPEDRVQKSYFLSRFFDMGRAILRESKPGPDILGVSRRCFTFFRLIGTQLPIEILHWVLSQNRRHRFHQKCETWKTVGQIVESYRQWRSRRRQASDVASEKGEHRKQPVRM